MSWTVFIPDFSPSAALLLQRQVTDRSARRILRRSAFKGIQAHEGPQPALDEGSRIGRTAPSLPLPVGLSKTKCMLARSRGANITDTGERAVDQKALHAHEPLSRLHSNPAAATNRH